MHPRADALLSPPVGEKNADDAAGLLFTADAPPREHNPVGTAHTKSDEFPEIFENGLTPKLQFFFRNCFRGAFKTNFW